MPRVVARLLITILLIPIAIVFHVAVGGLCSYLAYLLAQSLPDTEVFQAVLVVVGLAIAGAVSLVVFFPLWRGVVAWTPRRRASTVRTAVYAALLAAAQAVGWFVLFADPERSSAIADAGIVFTTLLVMIVWVIVWIETPAERTKRLGVHGIAKALCPNCRYDMSGLTNLRCPECGLEYSLAGLIEETSRRAVPPSME
jgi:hypothetical protein